MIQVLLILLGFCLVDASKRCQHAGHTAVASDWVLLKRHAAGKTAGELAGIKVIEELAVMIRVHPQLPGDVIVKGPANVVVAADVIDPATLRIYGKTPLQRLGQ